MEYLISTEGNTPRYGHGLQEPGFLGRTQLSDRASKQEGVRETANPDLGIGE